jgi:hypothetical protein
MGTRHEFWKVGGCGTETRCIFLETTFRRQSERGGSIEWINLLTGHSAQPKMSLALDGERAGGALIIAG